MFIRMTKWECRRLVDILRTRCVKKPHYSWADNLAGIIEKEVSKAEQKERDKNAE